MLCGRTFRDSEMMTALLEESVTHADNHKS